MDDGLNPTLNNMYGIVTTSVEVDRATNNYIYLKNPRGAGRKNGDY